MTSLEHLLRITREMAFEFIIAVTIIKEHSRVIQQLSLHQTYFTTISDIN